MNRDWSEQNKKVQQLLKNASFDEGIGELIALRKMLMEEMLRWRGILPAEDYCKIPFLNVSGYHNKTVAYSIWHIMRIEDIVVNTLIRKKTEVLFSEGFQSRIASPIITTGNELEKEQIAEFSRKLDIDALYEYANAVCRNTDLWLCSIRFEELKRRFSEDDKERIRELGVVSVDERASWLIDYWCAEDVAGLLKMPLSRHWIMHIEAAGRIIDKIND